MSQEKLKRIKGNLAKDNWSGVFDGLYSLLVEDSPWYESTLLLLQSRYSEIEKKEKLGILERKEYVLGLNRVKFDLFELISRLEKKLDDKITNENLPGESLIESIFGEIEKEEYGSKYFVGREEELELIKRDFEKSIVKKNPVFIFIQGEFGSGKTALVNQFISHATNTHDNILIGRARCSGEGGDSGYFAFTQILIKLFREKYLNKQDAANILTTFVSIAPGWLKIVLPHVGRALIGNELFEEAKKQVALLEENSFSQESMFIQLSNLLSIIFRNETGILFIDDIHFSDESSLRLLFHLIRNLKFLRIIIILTHRPINRADSITKLEAELFEEIRLEMIAYGASEIILNKGIDCESYTSIKYNPGFIPSRVISVLNQKSGGNPLFIEQIFSFWEESGVIVFEDDQWHLRGDLSVGIPRQIKAILKKRMILLEKLGESFKDILEKASVEGEVFSLQTLEHLMELGKSGIDLENHLLQLEQKMNFIAELEPATFDHKFELDLFKFNHRYFQEFLYEELSPLRKRKLHRIVGEFLEMFFEGQDSAAGILANHFLAGRSVEKALHYILVAAKHEGSLYAWIESKKWCEKGLSLIQEQTSGRLEEKVKEFQFLKQKGYACFILGENKNAHRCFQEAIECGHLIGASSGQLSEAYARLAEICDEEALFEEGLKITEKGLALFSDHEISLGKLDLLTVECLIKIRVSFEDSILLSLKGVIEDLDRFPVNSYSWRIKAEAYNAIGIFYAKKDDSKNAAYYYRKAFEIGDKIGDYIRALTYLGNVADETKTHGDIEEAEKLTHLMVKKSRIVGDKNSESYGLSILGEIQYLGGEYSNAAENLKESIQIMKDAQTLILIPYAFAILAKSLYKMGRINDAKEAIYEAYKYRVTDEWIMDSVKEAELEVFSS